jgi:hypothetical protein
MRSSTLALFYFIATAMTAQWSTDPANPLVICNAANGQAKVQAFSDGSTGWYALWLDDRLDGTTTAVYGQHMDEAGQATWTPNGKALVSFSGGDIPEFACAPLGDGNLLVAYIRHTVAGGAQDTLSAMAFDANGDPAWNTSTVITYAGTILGVGNITAITTPGGAYIGWYDTYFGGSNGVNVTRITNDGALPWGVDGYAVPNASYGPFEIHGDYADGLIVQWRTGNGSGAHLFAMRVDTSGVNVWPANVQTSAGSGGLNYGFGSTLDGAGAQLTAFVDMPHLIVMARLDTTGALTFSPSPVPVCTFSSDQDSPSLVVNDGYTFVAWTDNRPPASYRDLYLQKFDANGVAQWTADGVPAIQTNTYIPTSGLVPSTDGAVIATMDGNLFGFCAMRVLTDGTQDWPSPTAFCTPSFNPCYADQVKLADGAGGVVAFWSNQTDVYAARIYENGELGDHIGFDESPTTDGTLRLSPSPTTGSFSVTLLDRSRVLSIRAIDVEGRSVLLPSTRNSDRLQLDGSALANGVYTLELVTDAGVSIGRFIIDR